MPKILIIDDDRKLCELLVRLLKNDRYETVYAHSGEEAMGKFELEDVDLVLLDVMLPGRDGFEILRKIRTLSDIPVIMLTARGEIPNRISGFRDGADDYLPKPFEPAELLARIAAILRRNRNPNIDRNTSGEMVQPKNIQKFELDLKKRIVNYGGSEIKLTLMEFRLLEYFTENANQVISRSQLTEALYGDDFDPFRRTLDILISRVRKKLGKHGDADLISTVHGQGYIFQRK